MSGLTFFGKQAEPFRKGKTARAALHSSASNEAYTPPAIADASRYALGDVIDLDPCSCHVANEVIQARHIYTAGSQESYDGRGSVRNCKGGLFLPWGDPRKPTTVFLNPHGGFLNRETLLPAKRGMSAAAAWWYNLLGEIKLGRVRAAIYYCFRLDVLQNIQAEVDYAPPHAHPFCIFKDRPRHWHNGLWRDGKNGGPPVWEPPILGADRGKKGQPTHACGAFLALPEPMNEAARRSNRVATLRFQEAFTPLGYVRT